MTEVEINDFLNKLTTHYMLITMGDLPEIRTNFPQHIAEKWFNIMRLSSEA